MNIAHIIMQSKGGVGKSLVSALIAAYLSEKNICLDCVSTGPIHYTLARYKALNVSKIIHNEKHKRVNQANFDGMFNDFITGYNSILIDTSSNDFIPFNDYMLDTKITEIFLEHGKKIIIHCPITYGSNKHETINCLLGIIDDYQDVPIVVWENEFFGKGQNSFIHEELYKRPNNIIGCVKIESTDDKMLKQAFCKMLEDFILLNEISNNTAFDDIEKDALSYIKNKIWLQLDAINISLNR